MAEINEEEISPDDPLFQGCVQFNFIRTDLKKENLPTSDESNVAHMLRIKLPRFDTKDRKAFSVSIGKKSEGFRFVCTELGYQEEHGENKGMFRLIDETDENATPKYFLSESSAWEEVNKLVTEFYNSSFGGCCLNEE